MPQDSIPSKKMECIQDYGRKDGFSPVQDVFGHSIQILKPNLAEAYGNNKYAEKAGERKEELDVRRKSKNDQGLKNSKTLEHGTPIWAKNSKSRKWKLKTNLVVKVRNRTYMIVFEDGKISHRNRQKIKIRVEYLNQSSKLEENSNAAPKMEVDDDKIVQMDEERGHHLRRSKRLKTAMRK